MAYYSASHQDKHQDTYPDALPPRHPTPYMPPGAKQRTALALMSFLIPSIMPRPGSRRVGFCGLSLSSVFGLNMPYCPDMAGPCA